MGEHQKLEVLLLLSGYTFTYARLSATAADGVSRGLFDEGEQGPAFAALLREPAAPDRFPALLGAAAGGAFAPGRDYPDLELDLELLFDGVDALIRRQASGRGGPPAAASGGV